jgi:hypothetical protein
MKESTTVGIDLAKTVFTTDSFKRAVALVI